MVRDNGPAGFSVSARTGPPRFSRPENLGLFLAGKLKRMKNVVDK